jgi:hypothetical protein
MFRRHDTVATEDNQQTERQRAFRRRQALGLLWLALLVFVFCAVRAGRHAILLPRWWSLW